MPDTKKDQCNDKSKPNTPNKDPHCDSKDPKCNDPKKPQPMDKNKKPQQK